MALQSKIVAFRSAKVALVAYFPGAPGKATLAGIVRRSEGYGYQDVTSYNSRRRAISPERSAARLE
jgi:hypothetical protein